MTAFWQTNKILRRLVGNRDGSIGVETAFIMMMIGTMSLGVLDFGLAYSHNLGLANAARAGMQYAMVRKPVAGDYTGIIDAVNAAAPDEGADAHRAVTTTLFCECPDGSSIDCTSEEGEDLTCDDGSLRAAYLDIVITEQYSLFFDYPGLDQVLSLSESTTVRLN